MEIYYFIYIASFVLCILDFAASKILKTVLFISFCTFLIVLAGVRGIGVDNDSASYDAAFSLIQNITYSDIITGNYPFNFERGFVLLNKLIYDFGGNIHTLLFVVALISGMFTYYLIYKISPYPFSSLLFYISFLYLFRDFTQIRYGLAGSLIFFATYLFIHKKYYSSTLLFCLSLLFHNASYIMLLVLPFITIVKKKAVYMVLPFICTIGLFYNFFPVLLRGPFSTDHMQIYLDEKTSGGLAISILGYLLMIAFFCFKKESYLVRYKESSVYFSIIALGVSLNLLFFQESIFQRFSMLLFGFSIYLYPIVMHNLILRKPRLEYYLFYWAINLFFLYYGTSLINIDLIRPYF